jgi:hypothetical protein
MSQLTQDALAARAAGLTYGQWRAQQKTPTLLPAVACRMPGRRYCPVCGEELPSSLRGGTIYCSKLCCGRAKKIRDRERWLIRRGAVS